MMQDTLVLIKPDGVRRKMVGQIITALESRGFTVKSLVQKKLSEMEASKLYSEHKGKWHFNRNIHHITSGPVVIVHVSGDEAVNRCRQLVESIREANSDVIKLPKNIVHATSDPNRVNVELNAVGIAP